MIEQKKAFISRTFSRCVAEMCPGIVRLEYHLHDNGDEVVIIRCVDVHPPGGRHRTGPSAVRGGHSGGPQPGGSVMRQLRILPPRYTGRRRTHPSMTAVGVAVWTALLLLLLTVWVVSS